MAQQLALGKVMCVHTKRLFHSPHLLEENAGTRSRLRVRYVYLC